MFKELTFREEPRRVSGYYRHCSRENESSYLLCLEDCIYSMLQWLEYPDT